MFCGFCSLTFDSNFYIESFFSVDCIASGTAQTQKGETIQCSPIIGQFFGQTITFGVAITDNLDSFADLLILYSAIAVTVRPPISKSVFFSCSDNSDNKATTTDVTTFVFIVVLLRKGRGILSRNASSYFLC